MASRDSAAPGARSALLHDAEFVAAVRAAGVAVVFLHALNPYGFSHLHRTNEDNVDMNRNFRDFSTPPPRQHGVRRSARLRRACDVAACPGERGEDGRVRGGARRTALQQAITGGQCEFPDGLFYGGVAPAWSNMVFRAVLREHGAHRTRHRLDRFSHGPGSARPRRKDLFRPQRAGAISPAAKLVGRRRHVVPRRLVDRRPRCPASTTTRSTMNAAGATYAGIALEFGTIADARHAAGAARRPVADESS